MLSVPVDVYDDELYYITMNVEEYTEYISRWCHMLSSCEYVCVAEVQLTSCMFVCGDQTLSYYYSLRPVTLV